MRTSIFTPAEASLVQSSYLAVLLSSTEQMIASPPQCHVRTKSDASHIQMLIKTKLPSAALKDVKLVFPPQLDSHHPLRCLLPLSPRNSRKPSLEQRSRLQLHQPVLHTPWKQHSPVRTQRRDVRMGLGPLYMSPRGLACCKTGPHPRWSLARVCSPSVTTTGSVAQIDRVLPSGQAASHGYLLPCILFPSPQLRQPSTSQMGIISVNLSLKDIQSI